MIVDQQPVSPLAGDYGVWVTGGRCEGGGSGVLVSDGRCDGGGGGGGVANPRLISVTPSAELVGCRCASETPAWKAPIPSTPKPVQTAAAVAAVRQRKLER